MYMIETTVRNIWVGQKAHSGFSVQSYGKTQMKFWPIQ